jgi:hypothetical protein
MSVPTYLERIRTYYQEFLPTHVAELEDPEGLYLELAERISDQVAELSAQIEAASIAPGQTYVQRMGSLNVARVQAEEIAFNEILYSTPPETPEAPETGNSRDVDLAILNRESAAVDQRLEMEDGSAEAMAWDAQYPHLFEEVVWMRSDHDGLSEEQKRAQLRAIFAAQDAARASAPQQ